MDWKVQSGDIGGGNWCRLNGVDGFPSQTDLGLFEIRIGVQFIWGRYYLRSLSINKLYIVIIWIPTIADYSKEL
jgi:hypothetical protein